MDTTPLPAGSSTDEPRTGFGTRAARTWSPEWLDTVNAAAKSYGHAICGARTPAGTPCPARPTHPNGRCPHHGGFDLTGAPAGNRNAQLHGLYSRRLTICGMHCPLWDSCPLGKQRPGGNVLQVPPHERPHCAYEQAEYSAVLGDAEARADHARPLDAMAMHLAHDVAILRVMMTRALAHLAQMPLVDSGHVVTEQLRVDPSRANLHDARKNGRVNAGNGDDGKFDGYADTITLRVTRTNAALTAFFRTRSEFERAFRLIEGPREHASRDLPRADAVATLTRRHAVKIGAHPDDIAALHAPRDLPREAARRYLDRAEAASVAGNDQPLLLAFAQAVALDPGQALASADHLIDVYPRNFFERKDVAEWFRDMTGT